MGKVRLNRHLFSIIIAAAFKIFFFLISCPHVTEASLEELNTQVREEKNFVPNCILHFSGNNPEHILIVEKSAQRAYLYRSDNIDNPMTIYKCSTGKNKGAKSEVNDKKTPEGVYFINKAFSKKYLSPIYGARAFSIDYPNRWDRRLGRKGYGIWLHGTNRPLNERDTNGCIVFNNKDIIELSKYLVTFHTPIIITQEINATDRNSLKKEVQGLKSFLLDWITSCKKDSKASCAAFYSKIFHDKESISHQTSSYKMLLYKKMGIIDMEIDNFEIYRENGVVLSKFTMNFIGKHFFTTWESRLYLFKNENKWKIVEESFTEKKVP